MLIKQPNGKYCFCSYMGQNKEVNLTEEDVINKYIESAKVAINNAEPFGKLIATQNVSDEELKEMGSDKTLAELLKYIPLKPKSQSYSGRDFTTYGKCPSCGSAVQDGIGGTDEKCRKCGQLLTWK